MPTLTHQAWARIRADYEHGETPIEDICAEHGISSGTLRDRMRRWGWTRRRQPIPAEGPPPLPAPFAPVPPRAIAPPAAETAAAALFIDAETAPAAASVAPPVAPDSAAPSFAAPSGATAAPLDATPAAIARRLQGAVAHVLPAIERTLATLAAGTTHPREMDGAARTLGALTRTLRELNALLAQHPVADDNDPTTLDEFRRDLMRKMNQVIAERPEDGGAGA